MSFSKEDEENNKLEKHHHPMDELANSILDDLANETKQGDSEPFETYAKELKGRLLSGDKFKERFVKGYETMLETLKNQPN